MLRTGEHYRESLRDGRQVWINGERVKDMPTHPAFRPIVDLRARFYDMAHEAQHRELTSYVDDASNEAWSAQDRRLLAFARDLLNSDYAGHRLTFELFAQSPPFAHLNAVYTNFDFKPALAFVKRAAGLSDKVM